ncbi:MAG: SDR family NAD(P)-dependent oxidoreductase [Planctomycetes bacterium]|nr:SDR family NAD(P)-dependent oxidoreductase [Planctomycetota bacterium]
MARKVLVTGGAGFIGSHLVDALVARGEDVTVFDVLDAQVHKAGAPPHLNRAARFIQGDVKDYGHLKKAVREAEVIFHLAAAVGVGQSQYQIRHYVSVNTLGTANLLDIVVNHGCPVEKLVVASSMSSYGEGKGLCPNHGPVDSPIRYAEDLARGDWEPRCPSCRTQVTPLATDESARRVPESVYALGKMDQEELVMIVGRAYGIPVVALRYFNVYGPRQSLSNPYTGVAAIFSSRIKNNSRPLVFEDGRQTRDFVSVFDIVQANLLALDCEAANSQVFNVGSGRATTIGELAVVLAKLYGRDLQPILTGRYRSGDIRHCVPEITKIRRVLGYQPQVDLIDGLRELVEWGKSVAAEDRVQQATQELVARGLAA